MSITGAKFITRGYDFKDRILTETMHTDYASARKEAEALRTRVRNRFDRVVKAEVLSLGTGRKPMTEKEFLKTSWKDWRE